MLGELKNFESNFGISFPLELSDFYSKHSKSSAFVPTGFKFSHVLYALEIQYLLDACDIKNHDIENNLCSFAVTTDGYKLLVNLNTENLQVLQNEFGDIDDLGITMKDLLEAESYFL